MKLRKSRFLVSAFLLGTAGCTIIEEDGEPGATGKNIPPPVKSVEILVDANRDGYINDADSAVKKDGWDATQGAAFLPNLDNDDNKKDSKGQGIRDSEDEVVNGENDAYDLARIFLRPFKDAPKGAEGTLRVSSNALRYVRIFRTVDDGKSWTAVIGGAACDMASCPDSIAVSEDQIKNGVQFGIEGRTLVGVPEAEKDGVKWNGFVDLTYTVAVNGKPVSTSTSPDGTDRARMRVAPWMMNGNTTPYTDTLMAINYGQPLLPAMQAAVDAHNAANPNTPVNFLRIKDYNDQWVEDWIQTGTASIPWADGAVTGMRLAMPRPFSNGGGTLPVSWLRKSHTYADTGHFVVYKKAPSGSSFDSHGNHDLVPAYSHNGQSFPFGRIIHGSSILSETHEFYNAQQAQGPALVVKTSWLLVGHVDEVFSYVPAATPRGWKLLVASAKLARTQLQDWQKAGQGSATMFYGKKWGANKGGANAEVSIDAVLGDTALMAESQKAQTEIDGMVATMKSEVGLTDDEIVELPTLFEADGGMIAFQPGVVNSRVFNGYIVVPEPFGPKVVNGQDGIREFIKEQLATEKNKLGADGKGLKVFFADDWDLYHRLDGEVHCGSNTSAPPQKEWKWWEKVQ